MHTLENINWEQVGCLFASIIVVPALEMSNVDRTYVVPKNSYHTWIKLRVFGELDYAYAFPIKLRLRRILLIFFLLHHPWIRVLLSSSSPLDTSSTEVQEPFSSILSIYLKFCLSLILIYKNLNFKQPQ